METDGPFSVLQLRLDGGGELAVAKDHLGTRLQLSPRTDQTLPQAAALINKEKHFTGSAGRAMADEPGGQNPGVVQHQTVPWPQKLWQIEKVVVGDSPGGLVQGEQTGGVPPLQGGLGNEFLRELEVKISCFQRHTSSQILVNSV